METFRWAYIGSGKIAYTTANEILKKKNHTITAVYSRNTQTAAEFAKHVGAVAYDDIKEFLKAPDIDAVYVATPHASHYVYAKRCIAAKKPCLVEKAFTINSAETKDLIEDAEKNQVFLAEAMWTIFSPVLRQVKAWIEEGKIGKVQHVSANFAVSTVLFYKVPRLIEKELGGGALLDLGVYPISVCHYLFGKPEQIECTGDLLETGVDAGENIVLKYADGLVCDLDVSLYTFKGRPFLEIEGENGTIRVKNYINPKKAVLQTGKKRKTFRGRGGYCAEFDQTAEDVRVARTQSSVRPLSDTLAVMEIMDECRKQLGVTYLNDELV